MGKYKLSWKYLGKLVTNWWLLAVGIAMGAATIFWVYLLKNYELSVVHPLTCFSYVFSLLLSKIFFYETIPITRWIGIICIILGVYFVLK